MQAERESTVSHLSFKSDQTALSLIFYTLNKRERVRERERERKRKKKRKGGEMSATSQAMLNQGLFEDQEMPSQLGFYSFHPSLSFPQVGCQQALKAVNVPPSLAADAPSSLTEALLSSAPTKQREDITAHLGGAQLLSLQRSTANLW